MENWDKYFERKGTDPQSSHDDIKEELVDFFTWLDSNGFITGNYAPFGEKTFEDIADDYINDKRKNSKWTW